MDFPSYGLPESRLPPSNLQAEQALLGALISDPDIDLGALRLKAEHFVDPIHGVIFRTIAQWTETKRLISVDRLKAEFDRTGELDEVGGTPYLVQLTTASTPGISIVNYAASIRDAWVRRQLIWIGEELIAGGFGERPELDGEQQLAFAQQELTELAAELSR